MTVKYSEYKGHPVIVLINEDSEFDFTFGVSKARLILDNIDAIRQFVEDNE